MFIFQGVAADQISYDGPSLSVVAVFEAHDDHAVPGQAAAPTVVAVFFADFGCRHELEVAICTDVVVPLVAFETVESSHGGRNWVGTNVAFGGEGEDLEAFFLQGAREIACPICWCARRRR